MKKNYILLGLFCLFSTYTYTQQQPFNIDSLKLVFEGNETPENRLEACGQLVDAFIEQEDSIAVMHYIAKGVTLAENTKNEQSKLNLKVKEAYLLFRRDHYDLANTILDKVLAESRKRGWNEITANCLNIQGLINYNKSKYDTALPLLTEALELRQARGDKLGIGRSFINVGRIYFYKGNHQKALEFYKRGLEVSQEVNDTKNIIRSYNDLGIVHGTLRDLQKASHNFHKGLEIAEQTQNLDGLSQSYGNLGVLYKIKRDYKQAIYYHEKSIDIFKRQNDRLGIAIKMSSLANIYNMQGNIKESLRLYDSANNYFRDIGHKHYLSNNYTAMGIIGKHSGDISKAKYYYKKAAIIAEEIQGIESMANNYNKLGKIYLEQQQEDSAFFYLNKAFSLYKDTENTNFLVHSYRAVGNVYAAQANLPKAINFYQKALQSAEAASDTLAASNIYAAIGGLYMQQGSFNRAYSNYKNALDQYEQMNENSGVADMNNQLASVFYNQKNYKKALQYSRTALNTYQKFKDSCNFGIAYLTLAQSHTALKRTDSSSFYLQKALSNALKCKNIKSPLLASIYGELGAFYQNQNKKDSAFIAYENALKYASLSQNRLVMKNAAEVLYPIYEKKGELAKAYETYKIYDVNKETLFNEKNTRALVQNEYEKELQKNALIQQKKEAELASQKWLNVTLILACFAFILIALALYRNFRNKRKANELLRTKNLEISTQRARLEVLDDTKSRFFANISHELRTPLTLISSPLQTLLKNNQQASNTKEGKLLKLMHRNTETLKVLVNDIMDLSKLESNKMNLEEVEVDIKTLLMRVASNFDSLARHHGLEYNQLLEELPEATILTDAGKLEKILNNLLSNAIKHTSSGGKVSLIAKVDNEELQIKIIDTGQGIAAVELPLIFDRFYQSIQPDAPLQGGTGIGLSLAKEFCELMGGSIQVESELNQGSTFTVSIPYCVIYEVTEKPKVNVVLEDFENFKEFAGLANENREFNILIVEDHPDMQAYINNLIAPLYTTFLAANGKEALKVLESETVDLIISDIMMPEMDGYSLLQQLKASDKYHQIPTIMLTALGDEMHKLEALTIGVDDYLTKPFSPEELRVRIHNLIQRYVARIQWQEQLALEADLETESNTDVIQEKVAINTTPHLLEKQWLDKVAHEISSNLENEDFRLTDLAEQFNLSYRQFLRRIKKLTGLSLKQYQQEIALQKARELLENGVYGNASAVAYSVGISHVTRFSKLYEARFGKNPREYFASFNNL